MSIMKALGLDKKKYIKQISESALERRFVKQVKKMGAYVRKIESPENNGIPDRLVIYKGYHVFVELKRFDGRVQPVQRHEHSMIRRAGGTVVVINSRSGINEFCSALYKKAGRNKHVSK